MTDKSVFESLFQAAKEKGGLQYIFTLVRVDGISRGRPDPLLLLREESKKDFSSQSATELHQSYKKLLHPDVLSLIFNLLNCSNGEPYNLRPFIHLRKGQFPNWTEPSPEEMVAELIGISKRTMPELASALENAFQKKCNFKDEDFQIPENKEKIISCLESIRNFTNKLLDIYFSKRALFKTSEIYKMPGFEVLELLRDDELGLHGFNVHFSNGSKARFIRGKDSVVCENITLDVPISFFVGMLDELCHQYKFDGKPLYEKGLSGRYNKDGEWKPLVYPGKTDALDKEAHAQSNDTEIAGIIFYMLCTGYRAIEFVAKINIELPMEGVSFGEEMHLWKCPPLEKAGQNFYVYDGTYFLKNTDPASIKQSLANINVILNRLAFAYSADLSWRIKYDSASHTPGCAKPSKEDLEILDEILKEFPLSEDALYLDSAIDWYNKGRSSKNPLTAFLCFYIAIESIVIAVGSGDADLKLGYTKDSKEERNKKREECIKSKHDLLYIKDPTEFIRSAYFECVESLKSQSKKIIEIVFGKDHPNIKALFEKDASGYSLSDIRSLLAHGNIIQVDPAQEEMIAGRVHEIRDIAKSFLMRVIFFIKGKEALPKWSGLHAVSSNTSDPRSTYVVSDEKMIPNKDWRIRPEWCD